MNEVRARTCLLHRLDHARGAEQVGLRREVGRIVELHGRGRVDDDVALAELLHARVGQPEPVATQVELENRELVLDERRECLIPELLLQPLEGRACEHLALQPLRGRPPRARADGEIDAPNVRDRTEAFLDERFAQEAGAAGDQDGLALQGLGYQDRLILVFGRYCTCPLIFAGS